MTAMSSIREAPEHVFAKRLAANEKKIRDKAVKKLRKWLSSRSGSDTFSYLELLKIWKGLFYCMYMSDKPLIQEELSETIGGLIHAFGGSSTGLEFFRAGLQVVASEWNGIDKWRMDKFMMLLRRLLRHSLIYIKKREWSEQAVNLLAQIISEEVINANTSVTSIKMPLTIQVQFTDILLEELAKVGGETLDHETVMSFVQPFIEYLGFGTDPRLRDVIRKSVFYHLINQSDVGIAHQSGLTLEEFKEAMQDSEPIDDESQPKDPRAGKVDIALPQLRLDYDDVASKLLEKAGQPGVKNVSRKFMYKLVENFKDLAAGVYPLSPVLPEVPAGVTYEDIDEATERYLEEEEEFKKMEMEERKKIRKIKMQEKKSHMKEAGKVAEDEPVLKSNKQLKKEKRNAEMEEKIAKKRKPSSDFLVVDNTVEPSQERSFHEDEEEIAVPARSSDVTVQVQVEQPVSSIADAAEPTTKRRTKKTKVPKSRMTESNSDTLPEAVTEAPKNETELSQTSAEAATKKDERKKIKVPKSRTLTGSSDVVPETVAEAPKIKKPHGPSLVELAAPAPVNAEAAVVPVSVKPLPKFNKPEKRKIEFSFDDDIAVNEAAIERAIKKTKQERRGNWVPGTKTVQDIMRRGRIEAKKAPKKEKVADKPAELADNLSFAVLKSAPKKQAKDDKPRIVQQTDSSAAPSQPSETTVINNDVTDQKVETITIPSLHAKEAPTERTEQAAPVAETIAAAPAASVEQKPALEEEWNTSLQEGEIEIVIPNKKYSGKYKLKAETKVKESEGKRIVKTTTTKSSKVKFVLQKNKAQDPLEYMRAVKTSPGIPHDPNKKPKNGVLKLTESPVPQMPSFDKKKKKSSVKFMTNVAKRKFVR